MSKMFLIPLKSNLSIEVENPAHNSDSVQKLVWHNNQINLYHLGSFDRDHDREPGATLGLNWSPVVYKIYFSCFRPGKLYETEEWWFRTEEERDAAYEDIERTVGIRVGLSSEF